MTDLAGRVWQYCRENRLLEGADTIVAGVSGGADSVCLLLVLLELRALCRENGEPAFTLTAVHVNHGIRPEAGEDEAWVEALCTRLGVSFLAFHEDVQGYAKSRSLSEEEAGRILRYRDMRQALGERPGRIAVAHHADDRAETLLFHLFRGTGLAGMGSIRPLRGDVIRPLLDVSRRDIEAYLKERGQDWRIDATNAEDTYTRNRIRHYILPFAEREICRGAGEHLAAEAALLAETAQFVQGQTLQALARCQKLKDKTDIQVPARCQKQSKANTLCLSCGAFAKEDPFLQNALLAHCLNLLGRGRDLTRKDVAAVRRLFSPDCQSGRQVRAAGVHAWKEFDTVILASEIAAAAEDRPPRMEEPAGRRDERQGMNAAVAEDEPAAGGSLVDFVAEPPVEGDLCVSGLGKVRCRILEADPAGDFLKNIPQNQYTKWFDYDKIIKPVRFRSRQAGDYLTINEKLQKKKLQDYLIEQKIPARLRDQLMVLAEGSHILWVPGYRISAAYKVTKETRRIWEVYIGGEEE